MGSFELYGKNAKKLNSQITNCNTQIPRPFWVIPFHQGVLAINLLVIGVMGRAWGLDLENLNPKP